MQSDPSQLPVLPNPSSPSFPDALKTARESAGLNRLELAKKAGIHHVMIGRYEDKQNQQFTRPTIRTWMALSKALECSTRLQFPPPQKEVSLPDATIEQIVGELKNRGFHATLTSAM
jgi:transcriptional regulator with XRE-family HTH domain